MLVDKNHTLSTLHRVAAFILISDLVYAIYNIFVHMPKYFIGSLLGLIVSIVIQFLCARSVKTGTISSRIGSIVLSLLLLNMFPIGTTIAAAMLFFSLFKWEKNSTFQLPIENQKADTSSNN